MGSAVVEGSGQRPSGRMGGRRAGLAAKEACHAYRVEGWGVWRGGVEGAVPGASSLEWGHPRLFQTVT